MAHIRKNVNKTKQSNTNNTSKPKSKRRFAASKLSKKPNININIRKPKKSIFAKSNPNKQRSSVNDPNVIKLFKKEMKATRAFIGHFQGSVAPQFTKSSLTSIREDPLQTQIEKIEKEGLRGQKKEFKIKRIKFNTKDTRDFWFDFNESSEKENPKTFLGKPKMKLDSNFEYCVIEIDTSTNRGQVFPAKYMEFSRENQMVSGGNAEEIERMYRKQMRKRNKYIAESENSVLSKLFGHNKPNNNESNTNTNKSKNNKKSKSNTPDSRENSVKLNIALKSNIKYNRNEEDNNRIRELLNTKHITPDVLLDNTINSLQITSDEIRTDAHSSKRFKKSQTRGNMEEATEAETIQHNSDDEADGEIDADLIRNRDNEGYDESDNDNDSEVSGMFDDTSEDEIDDKMNDLLKRQSDILNTNHPIKSKLKDEKNKKENDSETSDLDWSITDDESDEESSKSKSNSLDPSQRSQRPDKRKRTSDSNIKSNIPSKKARYNPIFTQNEVVKIFKSIIASGKTKIRISDIFSKLARFKGIEKEHAKLEQGKKELLPLLKAVAKLIVRGNERLWTLKPEYQ